MKKEVNQKAELRKQHQKKKKTLSDCRFKRWIGIDPGKSGGLTVITEDEMRAYKCPDTANKMATLFGIALNGDAPVDVHLCIEQVWARPNNPPMRAFNYGINYGLWFGIAAAYEVEVNIVSPQKWMSYVGCPKGMEVNPRKNWLKEKAKELYPDFSKITLSTADSILIARYGQEITTNS